MLLYLDPFMGISGDMLVGALVDAGAPEEAVNSSVESLGIEGLRFAFGKVNRRGIQATSASATIREEHHERNFEEIVDIMAGGRLPAEVFEKARAAFQILAEAEAKVHGRPVNEVHFHEVGAADSIADIVGACAAWHSLGCPPVRSGPFNLGAGIVSMAHGTFPVPAPATAEILRGAPVFSFGEAVERTTPTGAALARALASSFGPVQAGELKTSGYGAGTRDTESAPNVLRVMLITEQGGERSVSLLETQIDDMSPEHFAGAVEVIRGAGARDVFTTPIYMKKGRPAWLLTALCPSGEAERICGVIFEATTTTGIRISACDRRELPRESFRVDTPTGPLRVKEITLPSGKKRLHPEWDDLCALSRAAGKSPADFLDEIRPLIKRASPP